MKLLRSESRTSMLTRLKIEVQKLPPRKKRSLRSPRIPMLPRDHLPPSCFSLTGEDLR